MQLIITERGGGKTKQIIKLSAENWYYIVCFSQEEAHRIFRQAVDQNIRIPFPITFDDFLNKRHYGKGIKGFLIDNVDMLIQHLAGNVPVEAITATIESK